MGVLVVMGKDHILKLKMILILRYVLVGGSIKWCVNGSLLGGGYVPVGVHRSCPCECA